MQYLNFSKNSGCSLHPHPHPRPPAPCSLPPSVDITARRGLNPVGRHAELRRSHTATLVTLLPRRSPPHTPGQRGKLPHGESPRIAERSRRQRLFEPRCPRSCVPSRTSSAAALVAPSLKPTLRRDRRGGRGKKGKLNDFESHF